MRPPERLFEMRNPDTIGYWRIDAPDDPVEFEGSCDQCEMTFGGLSVGSAPYECRELLPLAGRFPRIWKDPQWIYNRLLAAWAPGDAYREAEAVIDGRKDNESLMWGISALLWEAWKQQESRAEFMVRRASLSNRFTGAVDEPLREELFDVLTLQGEPYCQGRVGAPDSL